MNTENKFQAMTEKFAKKSEGPSGTYLKALSADERKAVESFGDWLQANTEMTTASVASYRSYLAAAIVAFKANKTREDLTSSQRSAVNKFTEYLSTLS
jgi:hypothetical protein